MKNLRIDKNHENSKNKNNEKKRNSDKNGNEMNRHGKYVWLGDAIPILVAIFILVIMHIIAFTIKNSPLLVRLNANRIIPHMCENMEIRFL